MVRHDQQKINCIVSMQRSCQSLQRQIYDEGPWISKQKINTERD